MADYAEIICQAVDTIVSKKLEGISFDTTVTCTITNADYAEQGQYTVTNGSANFIAYSMNTEYKVKDVVYVTIPNGDFNKQKLIVGKQVTDTTEPFVFTNPFKTMLDVTNNLIIGDKGENGLVANCPWEALSDIPIWTQTFYNKELKGYTRLGLSAQFQTWLTKTVKGEYGLRLEIVSEEKQTASLEAYYTAIYNLLDKDTTTEDDYGQMEKLYNIGWGENDIISFSDFRTKDKTAQKEYISSLMAAGISKYTVYLNTEDMYGNPYNFETYFSQEKVFDISGLGRILEMTLYFYQPRDEATFYNIDGEQLEYQDFLGNALPPNIFMKDPYVCVGYDLSTFNGEQAILYTIDSSTYLPSDALGDESNTKNIQLRWLHRFEDDNISLVDVNTDLDYDVRWYRYNLGAPSADEYSDVYWERINLERTENRTETLETLDSITNFVLLYHYDNNEIGNSVTSESSYYTNFKPGYATSSGEEEFPSTPMATWRNYSHLSNWSQNCLDYYGFSSSLAPHAFVGQQTSIIQVDDEQGWEMLFKQGFVYHNNLQGGTDYFKKTTFTKSGCLHRVGFWELFTLAYRLYWVYPDKFDNLGVPNYWKTGGTVNTTHWASFAGKNLYTELSYYNNDVLNTNTGSAFTITTRNEAIRILFTYFTESFGEWTYVEDKYGLGDFRPKDDAVYKKLYEATLTLYSRIDNPSYTIVVKPDVFYYQLEPDTTRAQEMIKVIILYNNAPIRSNVLTFTNEREVVSIVTKETTSAVQIVCNDNTYGNYRIYNVGNELLDTTQSKYCRELCCYFDSQEYPDESILAEATSITWVFPAENTMITAADDSFTRLNYTDLASSAKGSANGIYEMYSGDVKISYDSTTSEVSLTRTASSTDGVSINPLQYYYISSYFSTAYSNNTIKCIVVKNSVTYQGIKEFTFGIAGTTGTDCTLIIDFDNNQSAVTVGGQYYNNFSNPITNFKTTTLTARLYDSENNPIDFKDVTSGSKYTFTWEWFCADQNITSGAEQYTEYVPVSSLSYATFLKAVDGQLSDNYYYINSQGNYVSLRGASISYSDQDTFYKLVTKYKHDAIDPSTGEYYIKIQQNTSNPYQVELKLKDSADQITYSDENSNTRLRERMNGIWILQVTLSGWGDYDLVAYKPIPLRRWVGADKEYQCVTGPDSVIYASSGEPSYYRDPYRIWLYPRDNGVTGVGNWTIFLPTYPEDDGSNANYIGTLSSKNILQPLNCYIADAPQYGVQFTDATLGYVVWTQPILTIQNNYPSSMLNEWNGKDIVMDETTGTILTSAFAAGRKESDDNTFSGVMLGDWSKSVTEDAVSAQTGIYGFHHGAMSYAFKEDGTGFIGKANKGRIYFDGDSSQIYSGNWVSSSGKLGSKIDLDDGSIQMNKDSGYKQTSVASLAAFNSGVYYENVRYQRVTDKSSRSGIYYLPASFEKVSIASSAYAPNIYFIYSKTTGSTEYFALLGDLALGANVTTNRVNNNCYTVSTVEVSVNGINEDGTISGYKKSSYTETWKLATGSYSSSAIYYSVKTYSKTETSEISDSLFQNVNYYYKYVNNYVRAVDYNPKQVYYTFNGNDPHYVTLSAAEEEYPLAIGQSEYLSERKFRVNWAGEITATDGYFNNGYFEGQIVANSGEINNEFTVNGTLKGGTFIGPVIKSSESYSLKNTSDEGYFLSADGFRIGPNFYVSPYGTATITSGTIHYNKTSYLDTSYGYWLSSDGLSLGSSFSVDGYGNLTAESAEIHGTVYASAGTFTGRIEASEGYLDSLDLEGTLTLTKDTSCIHFKETKGKIYSGNKTSFTDYSNEGFYLDYQGLNVGSSTNYAVLGKTSSYFYNQTNSDSGTMKFTGQGLDLFTGSSGELSKTSGYNKFHIGWNGTGESAMPFIRLGIGGGDSNGMANAGCIRKYGQGLWVGNNLSDEDNTFPSSSDGKVSGSPSWPGILIGTMSGDKNIYYFVDIGGTMTQTNIKYAYFAPDSAATTTTTK